MEGMKMGSLSLPHLLILAVVVLILFGGKNRISDILGDVGKGVKAFKKGLADDRPPVAEQAYSIEHPKPAGDAGDRIR
jgi:sec-independent protein translocase protein TatA